MSIVEKILHRRHQERPEPAPIPDRASHGIPFKECLEKTLGQILRLIRDITALAYEGIDRKPVDLAKASERLLALHGILLTRSEHDAPVRGAKAFLKADIKWRMTLGHP